MSPPERPWFRAYSEMTRDRKLRRLKPEHRWLWITVLCMAGASPERGSLFIGSSPARLEDIADEAALPLAKVRVGMTELEVAGMIERNGSGAWHLRNWADRQYESDRSTERVRALRERRRNVTSTVAVTPPESESDTEVVSHRARSQQGCGKPDDDDHSDIDPIEVTVRAVFERCADAKTHGIVPNAPGPYRTRVLKNLELEHGHELRAVIATHPDAPVQTLAGWVLGEANSLNAYRKADA